MLKKLFFIGVPIFILLTIAGLYVPIDSYTTTKGCPDISTPTQRLHLISGDSISDIKDGDVEPPPNVGCSANTKFVLYLL